MQINKRHGYGSLPFDRKRICAFLYQNSFLYDGNLLYSKHSCSTAQFRGCPLQLSRLLFGHISRLCTADQFLYIRKAALDLVTRTTVDGLFLLFISYFHLTDQRVGLASRINISLSLPVCCFIFRGFSYRAVNLCV